MVGHDRKVTSNGACFTPYSSTAPRPAFWNDIPDDASGASTSRAVLPVYEHDGFSFCTYCDLCQLEFVANLFELLRILLEFLPRDAMGRLHIQGLFDATSGKIGHSGSSTTACSCDPVCPLLFTRHLCVASGWSCWLHLVARYVCFQKLDDLLSINLFSVYQSNEI